MQNLLLRIFTHGQWPLNWTSWTVAGILQIELVLSNINRGRVSSALMIVNTLLYRRHITQVR